MFMNMEGVIENFNYVKIVLHYYSDSAVFHLSMR